MINRLDYTLIELLTDGLEKSNVSQEIDSCPINIGDFTGQAAFFATMQGELLDNSSIWMDGE